MDRIYTPEEYIELILKASIRNRFTVYKVASHDIISFKTWPMSYKKTTISDETSGIGVPKEQKVTFKISRYKQFLYNKANPGKVVAKPVIDGVTLSTLTLLNVAPAPNLPTNMAYPFGKVSTVYIQ